MREIEDRILGNPNAASILRTFFQDFVDGLLIADHKQLKTSNNAYLRAYVQATTEFDRMVTLGSLEEFVSRSATAAAEPHGQSKVQAVIELRRIIAVTHWQIARL